ncbi:O-acetyltransferase trimeric LpxA-like protein [Rhizobium gallicum bv. gallicum R602sp]|uniref:O-acetyltransferase trimeric LpxA-like protein n=1 Tax=Rhizobium gallicum bv. gallicum R602sp TaxID=1041138 RepID=A0A0B4X6N5_9HYPH|nr:acyltransferase [Rhizobium gallicum]AJD42385.1 O-acetyltransferase trimeric LpxA-like protein [Rhizobium gallicum bv. gallicum R602sp]
MPVELVELAAYADENNNIVDAASTSVLRGGKIVFNEFGSSVHIGEGVTLAKCDIILGRNSRLTIGNNCRISGSIIIGYESFISIGNSLNVTSNVSMRAVESTSIEIGDDCLLGSNISIRTTDGHPIYDAVSRQRLNPSQSIAIGSHVWIADDVLLLKGAEVGNATVVGARSVVTKPIPSNCVAVGNPARVVKTGVTWEHSPRHRTEQYYFLQS